MYEPPDFPLSLLYHRTSFNTYRILRDFQDYKKGDLIKEHKLPSTYLFRIRKILVIITKDQNMHYVNFKCITNPSEWDGFFVEREIKL